MKSAVIIFSLLFFEFASAQEKEKGTIIGYLHAARTKKELSGITIYLSPPLTTVTTKTDQSGFFIYKNIPGGTYSLNFHQFGYREINIDSLKISGDTICLDLKVKKQREFFYEQPVLNLKIHQGWRTMGEISVGIGALDGQHGFETLSSLQGGCQFNFDPNHFIVGPSIGWNASAVILQGGANLIYFTDFDKRTLFLNPHIGFTFNTDFDLYFGYNIPLMKNEMRSMVNHFTVTLSVPLLDRYWSPRNYFTSKNYYYDKKHKKLRRMKAH